MNSPSSSAPVFATTCWTQVLAARGDSAPARQALSDLCAAYYEPVVAYLRHTGQPGDEALDLAHEFFQRVLEGRDFAGADPGRGRFRSYLLGAVKHFLAGTRRRSMAARRGGGQKSLPLEQPGSDRDTSFELPLRDPSSPPGDAVFDRRWAIALVDRATARLASEWTARGRADAFALLKPWLLGDVPSLSRADAARGLGLDEGAFKVAIHRVRRRFREVVKAEIGRTVSHPGEVSAELAYLIEVLSGQAAERPPTASS